MSAAATALLRALLLPDATGRNELEAWCRRVDLQSVDTATHQLLPFLSRRLAALDISVPQSDLLRGVFRKTWYRNQRHFAALRSAGEVLQSNEIGWMVHGGFALAMGVYADLGLRMVDSACVVVRPADVDRAMDVLAGSGLVSVGRADMTRFGLAARFRHTDGGEIDVGAFVFGPGWPGSHDSGLWRRAVALEYDNVVTHALAPHDAVAEAATIGLAQPASNYCRLLDIAALARRADPEVSWADLVSDYRGSVLAVPISETLGSWAELEPVAYPQALEAAQAIAPDLGQRARFSLHRRGRRFARLPAWYLRAGGSATTAPSTSFIPFVKAVYNVDTAGEAATKLAGRLRRS